MVMVEEALVLMSSGLGGSVRSVRPYSSPFFRVCYSTGHGCMQGHWVQSMCAARSVLQHSRHLAALSDLPCPCSRQCRKAAWHNSLKNPHHMWFCEIIKGDAHLLAPVQTMDRLAQHVRQGWHGWV